MLCTDLAGLGLPTWWPFRWPGLGEYRRTEFPSPRSHWSTRSSVAPIDFLAFEQRALDNYPSEVIDTIQASQRASTNRIYDAIWRAFCSWCVKSIIDPTLVTVPQILHFLQVGLNKGLSSNTLGHQVAGPLSVFSCRRLDSLARHKNILRFLKGAANIWPPVVHCFPT